MTDTPEAEGLDAAYGEAPEIDRKVTGDPGAPPAAATETLGKVMTDEAEARAAQADRADHEAADGDSDRDEDERRKRAYALWEQEGRPDGRHEDHWRAAGDAIAPDDDAGPDDIADPQTGIARANG